MPQADYDYIYSIIHWEARAINPHVKSLLEQMVSLSIVRCASGSLKLVPFSSDIGKTRL